MRRSKKLLWTLSGVVVSGAVMFYALPGAFAMYASSSADGQALTSSIAAIGDSISAAVNVELSGTNPDLSWSTGASPSVHSIRQRIEAQKGSTVSGYNASISGASSSTVVDQANRAVASGADTVTILIGANDACKPDESLMTPVSTYRSRISDALDVLERAKVSVIMASIPNLQTLYDAGKDSARARYVWSHYDICASMLADPTSTSQADVDRRASVSQRVREYNSVLADECANHNRCASDNGAVYNTAFTLSDLSLRDAFHPSAAGQNKIAEAVWPAYVRLYPAAGRTARTAAARASTGDYSTRSLQATQSGDYSTRSSRNTTSGDYSTRSSATVSQSGDYSTQSARSFNYQGDYSTASSKVANGAKQAYSTVKNYATRAVDDVRAKHDAYENCEHAQVEGSRIWSKTTCMGRALSGKVTVTARDTSSEEHIANARFYARQAGSSTTRAVGQATYNPSDDTWQLTCDTAELPDGDYVMTIHTYDTRGETIETSQPVDVTVHNT